MFFRPRPPIMVVGGRPRNETVVVHHHHQQTMHTFETTIYIQIKPEARTLAIIYDVNRKEFRPIQDGDRPQCAQHSVQATQYILKINFQEMSTNMVHTVHANRACTVCGKHFIIDNELNAMCPQVSAPVCPTTPTPSPVLPSTSVVSQLTPHDVAPVPAHGPEKEPAFGLPTNVSLVKSDVGNLEETQSLTSATVSDSQTSASTSSATKKLLKEYNVDEICEWVTSLYMNPEPWKENTVSGRDLEHLTDEELMEDLKLTGLQVKKIRREMKQLL
mmetsp:Transcript_14495/g.20002  ORF Transcript_14495/g.20002 Transcript_14495/m.20002 type:complete len:274 (-) Transcript_14495:119-940(-)